MPRLIEGGFGSGSELIGRDAELALLFGQYRRAEESRSSTVLIRGEGGIGKSRLVIELTRRAAAMGATVLAGHATRFDRGIPFSVFGEIIANTPAEAASAVLDRVSELRSLLSVGVKAADPSESPRQRRDVLTAASGFIASLADSTPVILVWEDLHEADADSALLFMRLARQLGALKVLMIGSLRPQQRAETRQIEHLLEQLKLEGRGDVIDVERLERSQLRALVAGLIAADPDDALLDLVSATSRGNPFFATETTRALFGSADIIIDGTKGRLVNLGRVLHPNTALVHRFFQIGSVEAEVARVMSAFGRISVRHLPLVASIANVSVERVAASFDLLVADHLLVRSSESVWEFAHSVLREALYDDIGPAEQLRIHGRVASHLFEERARGFAVDITELATHVAECAEPGDAAATEVLAQAGMATAYSAPLVSARWFEKASALLPVGSSERTELVAQQASSMFRASRPDQAARLGREALQRMPNGKVRTRTLEDTVNSLYICGQLEIAIEVIEQEELRTGVIGSALEAQRANFRTQLGRDERAESDHSCLSPEASAAELAITLSHDLHRAHLRGDGPTVVRLLDALDRACAVATPNTRFAIYGTVALVTVQIGDTQRARIALDAAQSLRVDNRGFSIGGQLETAAIQMAFLQGRWDDALALIPDAVWNIAQSQAYSNEGWITLTECAIHVDRGDLRRVADIVATFRWNAEAIRRAIEGTNGRVALAHGDVQEARECLERAKRRVNATGFDGGSEFIDDALFEACLADDDRAAAMQHLCALESTAARTSWPIHRLNAQLGRAALLNDAAAANSAKEIADCFGMPIYRARASLLLGTLGVDVHDNLVAAYHAFGEVHALPWRQRVAAQMRSSGVPIPRSRADSSNGLTPTESILARLVCEGMTNRDIAAIMFYSTKTVEAYLTRLFAKTQYRSRLELARAVDRGELVLAV